MYFKKIRNKKLLKLDISQKNECSVRLCVCLWQSDFRVEIGKNDRFAKKRGRIEQPKDYLVKFAVDFFGRWNASPKSCRSMRWSVRIDFEWIVSVGR